MKILMLTWKSFGNEDILCAFRELGHSVVEYPFVDDKEPDNTNAVKAFANKIRTELVEGVFSFNYFPLVALACKEEEIPYFSWIYDSPYVRLYHYSVASPTNRIFVFDSSIYFEFARAGINTVHYLPMAANTDRLNRMMDWEMFEKTKWKNEKPISFIGSLYTEKHQFYQRLTNISPYTRGYLEGLMAAQKNVYGYNFIQDALKDNPNIVSDMQKSLPMKTGYDSVESIEYLFAQYVVNRQITAIERQEYLSEISKMYGLDLYTPDKGIKMEGCVNHGPVDYYDMAPYVFKKAKINLNISLRSIISGIPLRGFDIMGAGGFLLTNFQNDFMEHFVPGEDFVYYESKKDMLEKIDYYLMHESERAAIAQNGLNKIMKSHTYKHRVEEMLEYL